jgi:RNA polymerase sigma-70 factor (ECF subfamily)
MFPGMIESDDDWLRSLRGPGVAQGDALAQLRQVLLRGLRAALSGRPQADDAFHEDTVQESLLRILAHLDQFGGRSRFLTWCLSITIRGALSALRRKHWQDFSLDAIATADDGAAYEPAAPIEGELDLEARAAILHETHRIMQSELTEKQRTVLLSELQGVPLAEIARALGSKTNATYKLGHDARQALKRGLERAGYTATDILSAFPA